jgi:hypothetical protein
MMNKQTLKILSLCLLTAFVVFACGGGEEGTMEDQSASQPMEEKAEQKAEMTPAEIGQKVREIYVKTMGDLVELLKDKPEASAVMSDVETLKQHCVQELVELGRKREALDAAGRSTVDSQIRMNMSSFNKDPVFTSFNELQQHYFQERDFHELVLSFNIITQYANFDLLKKQAPEEAQRLGIE